MFIITTRQARHDFLEKYTWQDKKRFSEIRNKHHKLFSFARKELKELGKRKVPIVRIDKSLNKYKNVVLSPVKLEKANEMQRTVGLPKQWLK